MKIVRNTGNAIKVVSDNSGVILDPGRVPLDMTGINAVFLSRFTPGDVNLSKYIPYSIPVHMSKAAAILIKADDVLKPSAPEKINAVPAAPRKKIRTGDISTTPHLVDYSAYDALAFTLHSGGKNIFYSADPRGHRSWRSLFKRVTGKPADPVNCLVLNGIFTGKDNAAINDEHTMKRDMIKLFGSHGGAILITAGRHDIEKILSIYKACQASGRTLVMDLAAAFTLSLMRGLSERIPQPHWPGIRVKFSGGEASRLQAAGYRELLHFIDKSKIDIFDMRRKHRKLVFITDDPGTLRETAGDLGSDDSMVLDNVVCDMSIPENEIKEFIGAIKPGMVILPSRGQVNTVAGMFPDIPVKTLSEGETVEVV